MQGIHILHGPGEAFARLDHLKHDDVITSNSSEYRLVEDAAIWEASSNGSRNRSEWPPNRLTSSPHTALRQL